MTSIKELPGIQPAELSALKRAKIREDVELWERLEKGGLQHLATATGLNEERLFALLAGCSPRQVKTHWLLRHWPEVLVIASILLLLVPWLQTRNARQVVVGAPDGLPALHVIQEKEVALKSSRKLPDGFTSVSDVVGRLTLQEAPAGAPLRTEQVGPSPGKPLAGRRILSLPVRLEVVGGIGRGSRVGILLSPRRPMTRSPAIVIEDVLVLAVQKDAPPSILIGVKVEDLPRLGQHLGSADVFILQ